VLLGPLPAKPPAERSIQHTTEATYTNGKLHRVLTEFFRARQGIALILAARFRYAAIHRFYQNTATTAYTATHVPRWGYWLSFTPTIKIKEPTRWYVMR
jgi:hypothetical protein